MGLNWSNRGHTAKSILRGDNTRGIPKKSLLQLAKVTDLSWPVAASLETPGLDARIEASGIVWDDKVHMRVGLA